MIKTHLSDGRGMIGSVQIFSKSHLLTSKRDKLGVRRKGATVSVAIGFPARFNFVKVLAPLNISTSSDLNKLSDRSSSLRADNWPRSPLGNLVSWFLAKLRRVIAGIASNVPALRLTSPQSAHSKRLMLWMLKKNDQVSILLCIRVSIFT